MWRPMGVYQEQQAYFLYNIWNIVNINVYKEILNKTVKIIFYLLLVLSNIDNKHLVFIVYYRSLYLEFFEALY